MNHSRVIQPSKLADSYGGRSSTLARCDQWHERRRLIAEKKSRCMMNDVGTSDVENPEWRCGDGKQKISDNAKNDYIIQLSACCAYAAQKSFFLTFSLFHRYDFVLVFI